MNNKIIASLFTFVLTSGVSTIVSAEALLNPVLNFTDGVNSCQVGGTFPNCTYGANSVLTGSYFAMDNDLDGTFSLNERVAMTKAGEGVVLGSAQAQGTIDLSWSLFGEPGLHYTKGSGLTVLSLVDNVATIDMTGWTIFWGNPGTAGEFGFGLSEPAVVTCGVSCTVGDTFSLDYVATVSTGGVFKGFGYQLHLEGIIGGNDLMPPSNVPVPAAVWLFGSGLLGLAGISRRKIK